MKKVMKILAFAIALIVLCLSFTGCSWLTASKMHATYTDKDNKDTITYNGEEYIKLHSNNYNDLLYNNKRFCSVSVNFSKIINEDTTKDVEYLDTENFIFVTTPNVPSILAEEKGDIYYVSVDKNYLLSGDFCYEDIYGTLTFDESAPIYCKADMYEEIQSKLDSDKNFSLYGYNCCRNETENSDMHDHEYFYLEPDENDAIKSIIKNTEDSYTAIDEDWYFALSNRLYLDIISDDKLFSNGYIAICTTESGAYCIEVDDTRYYDIPEKYNELFDKLIQTAKSRGYDM